MAPRRRYAAIGVALTTAGGVLLTLFIPVGINPYMGDPYTLIVEERNIAALSLVEHRMKAVVQLATRVVVMHQGRIIAEGPPDVALNNPLVVEVYLGRPWRS